MVVLRSASAKTVWLVRNEVSLAACETLAPAAHAPQRFAQSTRPAVRS